VTDYVEGPMLADLLRHGRSGGRMRPGVEMVRLFASLGLALDYVHQQGVVHGNLNPGSILFRRNGTAAGQVGEPVLTDFDYARLLRLPGETRGPFYLAPEQIRGQAATARSDTYSLGVILYELCTGLLPFRGSRPIAIMMQHLNALPTPPEVMDPTISSALVGVIPWALVRTASDLPPTVSVVVLIVMARRYQLWMREWQCYSRRTVRRRR
jgi:eukaryotic-like serine/threonine-protein kinase